MQNSVDFALRLLLVLGVCLLLAPGAYSASNEQTLNSEARRMDSLTASNGGTVVTDKIASDFTTFAGSPENAENLVSGLRNGTEITLTDGTSSVNFTPPTGKMGYGNVFISLSLAQQQLASQGFTQPSIEQIQAALVGGTVDSITYQGILQMRSDGMGWGQIANSLGVKLGHVVSGIKSANTNLSSTTTAHGKAASGGGTASSGHTSGVQAGGGKGGGTGSSSKSTQGGSGIVTATGAQTSGQGASTKDGGSRGTGVVSGTGEGAITGAGTAVPGGGAGQGSSHGNQGGHGR